VDTGMDVTSRNWVVFQVKTVSDVAIALSSQPFNGNGSPNPFYELVIDETVPSLPGILFYHGAAKYGPILC